MATECRKVDVNCVIPQELDKECEQEDERESDDGGHFGPKSSRCFEYRFVETFGRRFPSLLLRRFVESKWGEQKKHIPFIDLVILIDLGSNKLLGLKLFVGKDFNRLVCTREMRLMNGRPLFHLYIFQPGGWRILSAASCWSFSHI